VSERVEARHVVSCRAVLVRAGAEGPEVLTGSTVDLGRGGCSLLLDEPIEPGGYRNRTCVLTVQYRGDEVRALTGPPILDNGAGRAVRLTLLPMQGAVSGWSEMVDELAVG
jgi:hypothetical protein